jgi:DUF4097 and DUF4098 domain-containing protein YvlB
MRIVALLACGLAAAAGVAQAEGKFERQIAAEPRGVVEISNVSGKVDVSGWDQPEVNVRAVYRGGVDHVDVTSEHGHTIIKVVVAHSHGMSWFGSDAGEVDLRVQIPKGSELDISATSADVKSTGVEGVQRLKTVSGDVKAEIAQSNVEVKTVSGDVELLGHGQPADLHVGTISGDVRLEHGAGELDLSSVSGDLIVSLDTALNVRVHTTSGTLKFDGKLLRGANFEAESVSGDVSVRASSESGYEFEATTFSGDINDCLKVTPQKTSQYGPGSRLNGTQGGGSAHVRLKTMSGDVSLCDH